MNTTKCMDCGASITYTTRRPKKCAACKLLKPKKRRGSSFPKSRGTKGEVSLFQVLNKMLPGEDYINNGFYSFLMSPNASPLQLDRFYPWLSLAFEYDGAQHTEYVKYIHKSRKNFLYQQQCDKLKDKGCQERNITLIRVSYKDKLSEDLIRGYIKAANAALYKSLFGEE